MKRLFVITLIAGLVLQVFPASVSAEGSGGLVQTVAAQAGISEDEAREQVKLVFSGIESELKAGREVSVRKFGRFYLKKRDARTGRNPKTGEKIQIPAKKYPRFTSSDVLKNAVNEAG